MLYFFVTGYEREVTAMGMIGNPHDFLILTNNPLVVDCLDGRGDYTIAYHPELDHRAILVKARDLIHKGHILYTHPLAGSVKPNETPYKSLIVSLEPHGMESEHEIMIGNAIAVYDKFCKIDWSDNEQALRDFQLIDYTLLCGAIGYDAAAGLSNKNH